MKKLLIDLTELNNETYNYKGDNSTVAGWSEVKYPNTIDFNHYGFHGKGFINEESKTMAIIFSGTTCFDQNLLTTSGEIAYAGMSMLSYGNNFAANLVGNTVTYIFNEGTYPINWSAEHRTDCGYDWISNMQQYFGYEPLQLEPALKFTRTILQSINNIKDYNVIISGHSLGAVISDLVNLRLTAEGFQVSSINFENPGSSKVMHAIAINKGIDIKSLNIKNINMLPNWVNSGLNKQVGEVYEFGLPSFEGKSCNESSHCHVVGAIMEAARYGDYTRVVAGNNVDYGSSIWCSTNIVKACAAIACVAIFTRSIAEVIRSVSKAIILPRVAALDLNDEVMIDLDEEESVGSDEVANNNHEVEQGRDNTMLRTLELLSYAEEPADMELENLMLHREQPESNRGSLITGHIASIEEPIPPINGSIYTQEGSEVDDHEKENISNNGSRSVYAFIPISRSSSSCKTPILLSSLSCSRPHSGHSPHNNTESFSVIRSSDYSILNNSLIKPLARKENTELNNASSVANKFSFKASPSVSSSLLSLPFKEDTSFNAGAARPRCSTVNIASLKFSDINKRNSPALFAR